MHYSIHKNVFTGLYHSLLLDGEYANCHGQGPTREMAYISLRIRVNQLRNITRSAYEI